MSANAPSMKHTPSIFTDNNANQSKIPRNRQQRKTEKDGTLISQKGVPHRGVPQKHVRRRASGATLRSGHVLRVFLYLALETRRIRYVSIPPWIRIGYVSMRACVAFGSGSQGAPPCAVPPLRPHQFPVFVMSNVAFPGKIASSIRKSRGPKPPH